MPSYFFIYFFVLFLTFEGLAMMYGKSVSSCFFPFHVFYYGESFAFVPFKKVVNSLRRQLLLSARGEEIIGLGQFLIASLFRIPMFFLLFQNIFADCVIGQLPAILVSDWLLQTRPPRNFSREKPTNAISRRRLSNFTFSSPI